VILVAGPTPFRSKAKKLSEAEREEMADAARLADMKKRLDELINSPVFKQFRSQILIDITTEGLRLQIVDSDKRPMFDLASAKVVPHMRAILRELAPTLNDLPNRIPCRATPTRVYTNGDNGNRELSADRANAAARTGDGGMTETKVLRVVGLADSMHLDNADPRNPINRRISVILLNRQTQERIERENSGAGATPSARVGAPLPATASGSNVKSTSFKPSTPTQ
jgi:chemotaxis protein MotB